MAISAQDWRSAVKGTLERISDVNYQSQAWFNKHEDISSPDELINQLNNDFIFDQFIEDEEIGLSPDQKRSAEEFSDLLSNFCERTPTFLDPYKTINDPRWAMIREEAGKLVQKLFSPK